MTKPGRLLPTFIIILAMSTLAISAGVAAGYFNSQKTVPPGINAGKLDIGCLDRTAAAKKIEAFYEKELASSKLELDINGIGKYYFAYPEIGAHVDGTATVNSIYDWSKPLFLSKLAPDLLGNDKYIVKPVIKIDEGMLRERLLKLKNEIDTEPADASVKLSSGVIVRKPEVLGLSLNIKDAFGLIASRLSSDPGAPVRLGDTKGSGIDTIAPKVTLKDLGFVQKIISSYTTVTTEGELADSIKLSSDAIDQSVITASGSKAFSFVARLESKSLDFQFDSDGYDQVASTLYAAVLAAGFDKSSITRLPHKLAPDYIEPGLDAWVSGNEADLKFANNTAHDLMILTEIRDNAITVAIAGSTSDLVKKFDVESVITQKVAPPVVNALNTDLKPGERVVLSQGKPGMTVEIHRNGELISTDTYDAVKALVQVGPDSGPNPDLK